MKKKIDLILQRIDRYVDVYFLATFVGGMVIGAAIVMLAQWIGYNLIGG